MALCSEYIKNAFPHIDDDLKQYVEGMKLTQVKLQYIVKFFAGVLQNGADDFEDSEEVYEAIGEVLQEVSNDKTEDDIRLYLTHY